MAKPDHKDRRGAEQILRERKRQVVAEGFNREHDLQYRNGELIRCVLAYLLRDPDAWPFGMEMYKPTTEERDLVKAGALIAAEIDRLNGAKVLEEAARE